MIPVAWVLLHAQDPAARDQIARAFERTDIAGLLANSIFLALLTAVFAIALGLPLALLLNLCDFPGRGWIGRIYFLPLVIPPHIHTIAWARVVGDRGWLTGWLDQAFDYQLDVRAPMGDPDLDAILGHLYPGPAWVMACAYFPLVTLAVGAGLRGIDARGVESARLLGSRSAVLWKVIVPQIVPRLFAGTAFVFLLALATYPVVSLLDTPVLIQKVFFTLAQAHGDEAAAAVIGLPLVGVALLVIGVLGRIEADVDTRQTGIHPLRPSGSQIWAVFAVLIIFALASGTPLGSLLWEAGPLNLSGDGRLDNYQSVVDRVDEAFLDSMVLAAAGVCALLVLSWPLGRLLARGRGMLLETVGLGTLAFPPEIIGVALLLFWSQLAGHEIPFPFLVAAGLLIAAPVILRARRKEALVAGAALAGMVVCGWMFLETSGLAAAVQKRGIWLVVLAYLARFLPFTVRMFRNGFRSLDPDEEDAARILGHGWFSRAVNVQAPRLSGVVMSVVVLSWVLCFTELPATLLTLRPGWQSVQVRIFNMVHYQSIGEVAALCVLVVILTSLPVVILSMFARRTGKVL